jgi:alpha-mannosidase
MGFDGVFFGRIDYEDKASRTSQKTMEMVWEGSANLG